LNLTDAPIGASAGDGGAEHHFDELDPYRVHSAKKLLAKYPTLASKQHPNSASPPQPDRLKWGTGGAPIHLAHSQSLYGPWVRQPADAPILFGRKDRWDEITTNPAPLILPNGTVLLAYRGMNGAGTDRVGVARAASWNGPYERVTDLPVFGQVHE
jgi:hypothetical protein